ncbi:hypothetical protein [Catellatospora tritici]|uniref:hypothetical protein n=1 Tax=Catellatospora tritici TaxID=2851566 RepID=UPI001C2D7DEA|nr:hypothetical protein [Catellatospora tritici]MBV1850826.1 hypothetical protein [Catellatospora tritici]MBV1851079.1 hypothetical protein [Catellatospora tritici]
MTNLVQSRYVEGAFHLYDLARHRVGTPLAPTLTVTPPQPIDKLHGHATHPALHGLAYATEAEVVRLDADGTVRWRLELGRPNGNHGGAYTSCAFETDGERLWVYVPDAMTHRSRTDRIMVVDAGGVVLAQAAVPSAGHGAGLEPHPGGEMIIDIGEGQDGVVLLRCRLDADRLEVHEFPWRDRCLIGMAPDGATFMTVDHGLQENVSFHTYPDSVELFRLTPADFGERREEAVVEWTGGYLDDRTAVVVLYGEDEDTGDEWFEHHLVDVSAREVLGRWQVEVDDLYDVDLVGDGTWLQPDGRGGIRRYAR